MHSQSLKKTLEKLKKNSKKNTPQFLIFCGVFFIGVSLTHWNLRLQALSLDANLVAAHQSQTQENTDLIPVHIEVPWFLDVGIEPQVYADGNWTISPEQASHLAQSAKPTENGNIIIYGHNTRKILGNIRALTGKEIITITTKNGEKHLYSIVTIDEVEPNEVEYLKPAETEVLTLYTCSGFLDSKRFIVRAVRIAQ